MSKVVKKETALAKLSEEQRNALFESDEGMAEIGVPRRKPLKIKILNDPAKQKVYFVDPEELSNKHVGKLFLDDGERVVQTESLTDSVEGTLLHTELGHLVYGVNEKGDGVDKSKYYGKFPGMIKRTHRELWRNANPHAWFLNQRRFIMTLFPAQTTLDLLSEGKNPFAVYTVSTASEWGAWSGIESQFMKALQEHPELTGQTVRMSTTSPTVFRIKITTEHVVADLGEFYKPVFEVLTNPLKEALELLEIRNALIDYRYYSDSYSTSQDLLDPLAIHREAVPATTERSNDEGDSDENDLPF